MGLGSSHIVVSRRGWARISPQGSPLHHTSRPTDALSSSQITSFSYSFVRPFHVVVMTRPPRRCPAFSSTSTTISPKNAAAAENAAAAAAVASVAFASAFRPTYRLLAPLPPPPRLRTPPPLPHRAGAGGGGLPPPPPLTNPSSAPRRVFGPSSSSAPHTRGRQSSSPSALPPPPTMATTASSSSCGVPSSASSSSSFLLKSPQEVLSSFVDVVPTFYVSLQSIAAIIPEEVRDEFQGRGKLLTFFRRYPFYFDLRSDAVASRFDVRLRTDVSHPRRGAADEKFTMTDVGETTQYVAKPEYIVSLDPLDSGSASGSVAIQPQAAPPAVRVNLEERVPVLDRLRALIPEEEFASMDELEEVLPEDVLFHPYFDCQGGLAAIASKFPDHFQVVRGRIRIRPTHLAPLALDELSLEDSPLPDVARLIYEEVCRDTIPRWVSLTPLYERLTLSQRRAIKKQFKSFAGYLRAHGRSVSISADMLQVAKWIPPAAAAGSPTASRLNAPPSVLVEKKHQKEASSIDHGSFSMTTTVEENENRKKKDCGEDEMERRVQMTSGGSRGSEDRTPSPSGDDYAATAAATASMNAVPVSPPSSVSLRATRKTTDDEKNVNDDDDNEDGGDDVPPPSQPPGNGADQKTSGNHTARGGAPPTLLPPRPSQRVYTRTQLLNTIFDRFPPDRLLSPREVYALIPPDVHPTSLPKRLIPWLASFPNYFVLEEDNEWAASNSTSTGTGHPSMDRDRQQEEEQDDDGAIREKETTMRPAATTSTTTTTTTTILHDDVPCLRRTTSRPPLDLALVLYKQFPTGTKVDNREGCEVGALLQRLSPAQRHVVHSMGGVEHLARLLPEWLRVDPVSDDSNPKTKKIGGGTGTPSQGLLYRLQSLDALVAAIRGEGSKALRRDRHEEALRQSEETEALSTLSNPEEWMQQFSSIQALHSSQAAVEEKREGRGDPHNDHHHKPYHHKHHHHRNNNHNNNHNNNNNNNNNNNTNHHHHHHRSKPS